MNGLMRNWGRAGDQRNGDEWGEFLTWGWETGKKRCEECKKKDMEGNRGRQRRRIVWRRRIWSTNAPIRCKNGGWGKVVSQWESQKKDANEANSTLEKNLENNVTGRQAKMMQWRESCDTCNMG